MKSQTKAFRNGEYRFKKAPRDRKEARLSLVRQEDQYLAIKELNETYGYSIKTLSIIYGVARSGYYKWLKRIKPQQEVENEALLSLISKIYEEHDGILGYRQMTIHLYRDYDWIVNHKRVYRLMKVAGIRSVCRKKRNNYIPCKPEMIAENILNRDFKTDSIHQKWLTDVTEFKYGQGKKAYLSAILDLGDRSIVAYKFGTSNNNQLVFDTFDEAVEQYPEAKPLFHSDRGFQYTNSIFKMKLDKAKMNQSMSRVGRCIDNGPMEGFWGIIKSEMYYLKKFSDYDSLAKAIDKYILYYNTKRYQKRLNKMAPLEYRQYLLKKSA